MMTSATLIEKEATAPGAGLKPLLVYVNVPFCNSRCHFCDWVTDVPIAQLRLRAIDGPRQRYIAALVREIEERSTELGGHAPDVVYWGGGTASILEHDEIEAIYRTLDDRIALDGVREATIEGSPESVDLAKFELFRAFGFNRVSLGVQSFDADRLRMIGRAHGPDQARDSVRAAHSAGFDNINIDLIVGFPGQTMAEVDHTFDEALDLPVNHFSVYPYRPSSGTVLRKQLSRGQSEIDADLQLALYARAIERLHDAGIEEYATAYFGDPICQSDEVYYKLHSDWIGFGSGANSLIDGRFKLHNRGGLHQYNQDPLRHDVDVPAASPQVVLHLLSQALTTVEGMGVEVFKERTGVSLRSACEMPEVYDLLERVNRRGHLEIDERGVRLRREDMASAYILLNAVDLYEATGGAVSV